MSYAQTLNLPAAIMQRGASPRMSNLYRNICTADVIDIMHGNGFEVVDYKVDGAHKRAAEADYGRHVVKFRQSGISAAVGEFVPQMLVMNSANGKTPLVARFGLYRFVCANGMVVGDDLLAVRVRHMGPIAEQITEQIRLFHENTGCVLDTVDQWRQIEMTREQALQFANRALVLRVGEEKAKQYDPAMLLGVNRAEDDAGSLWTTFNRVQETGTKGGIQGRNANNRRMSMKSLNAIGQDMQFNIGLWNLAKEHAELHKSVSIAIPDSLSLVDAAIWTPPTDAIEVQAIEIPTVMQSPEPAEVAAVVTVDVPAEQPAQQKPAKAVRGPGGRFLKRS